jgi:hypothetical protein
MVCSESSLGEWCAASASALCCVSSFITVGIAEVQATRASPKSVPSLTIVVSNRG